MCAARMRARHETKHFPAWHSKLWSWGKTTDHDVRINSAANWLQQETSSLTWNLWVQYRISQHQCKDFLTSDIVKLQSPVTTVGLFAVNLFLTNHGPTVNLFLTNRPHPGGWTARKSWSWSSWQFQWQFQLIKKWHIGPQLPARQKNRGLTWYEPIFNGRNLIFFETRPNPKSRNSIWAQNNKRKRQYVVVFDKQIDLPFVQNTTKHLVLNTSCQVLERHRHRRQTNSQIQIQTSPNAPRDEIFPQVETSRSTNHAEFVLLSQELNLRSSW